MVNSTNPKELSIDEDDGGTEVAVSARSITGTCYYIRLRTSGPSINILLKLMAVVSLIFGPLFI